MSSFTVHNRLKTDRGQYTAVTCALNADVLSGPTVFVADKAGNLCLRKTVYYVRGK